MFKQLLASVGIGAAKVDTVLLTDQLLPGQQFQAEIIIRGGEVEQHIQGLELALMTRMKVESGDNHYYSALALARWHLADRFSIGPGQEKRLQFKGQLHPETPITELPVRNNQTAVWLATGLSVDNALDPSDKDRLFIKAPELVSRVIQAMDELGLKLVKADVEKGYVNARTFRSSTGCYQELEFRPKGFGLFSINEVELSFVCEAGQTHVLIELDRAFRRDGFQALTFPNTSSVAELKQRLQALL
ncbi:sporulation protein [Rheinheimera sp.]|uniref:sporulation protein n=1 Tax=Rheinheimera sp. TaxID=1869214 RepID=UPI00307D5621